jgi:predicted acyltransferase
MSLPRDPTPSAGVRLLSLDAFRGLVIVLMFLVNVAGRDPAFPSWTPHRGWDEGRMGNGLADYVFPWFLFIVGVAIPFSMNSGRGRAMSAPRKLLTALKRGAVIYLLGTLLWCATIAYPPDGPGSNWGGPITWRVLLHWDILPLIGWGYFLGVAASLLPAWVRAALVAAILVAKWVLLTQVPLPGGTAVVWDQGRSAQHWLNARLGWIGVGITQGLPATAVVVLGSFAGDWLRRAGSERAHRAAWLAGAGGVLYLAGVALHLTGLMPASKDFFTSSYVMGTSGAAAMVLAAMYLIVDVRRWTSMEFFRVFGTNALAVYIGAEWIWKTVLMRWQVANPAPIGGSSAMITALRAHAQSIVGAPLGSILVVAAYIAVYWLACRWLYRRAVFIKV